MPFLIHLAANPARFFYVFSAGLCVSRVASLLVIGVLSSTTDIPPPVANQPAARLMPALTNHAAATSPPHAQATIYMSDSQNDAQLREWIKRNAESMEILKKTTKEMPLR